MSIKTLLASLLLIVALPLGAQELPGYCGDVLASLFNIAGDRSDGKAASTAHKNFKADVAEYAKKQTLTAADKAAIAYIDGLIDKVYALKPFSKATVDGLFQNELKMCLAIKGDYTKLQAVDAR